MNERVKELLLAAGVNDNWNEADWYSLSPEMVQKFAELIIKDCARVAFESDLTMAIGQWGADSAILKHFGVTE
jgi:hypothetical protein